MDFKTSGRVWDRERRQILVHGAPGAPETAEAIRTAMQLSDLVFITPTDAFPSPSDFLGLQRFFVHGVEPVPYQHLQWELSR